MLTIFSIPKPFIGHIDIIQRNAIKSWVEIEPRCEIFLCGNDQGVAEVAAEFDLIHIPDIEKNEFGTPLLNSAFNIVQQKTVNDLICYVNGDIILLNDVIDAIKMVSFHHYLLLGQRWNLDINDPIDFNNSSWEKEMRAELASKGKLQPPFGSDYFIFPKEINWNMPEFAVGRPGWDNWIIYKARSLQIPVVDATREVTVVHQNHDYTHIPEQVPSASFEGPEAARNRILMGGGDYSFNIRDVTHLFEGNSIIQAMEFPHLQYRLGRQPVLRTSKRPLNKLCRKIFSVLLYRRHFFPNWFWKNTIYYLTK